MIFVEDLECQSRELGLDPSENGESMSFRGGNVVIKSCFEKISLSRVYTVNQ